DTQCLDVLWVRWFGEDPSHRSGWKKRRLPQIRFIPENKERGWNDAFGFFNLSDVIQGAHIIPAFHFSQSDKNLLYHSIARHPSEKHIDWCYYYVNMFVNRDMFMCYRGGGIGH
ncbi:hypothetical protein BDN71DRAFT_1369586, partial [Pleurotus eryngii]